MSELKAGAAKTDITPDFPVMLEGNPRDHKSEGAHDPISGRALFLDGGDEPVLLVMVTRPIRSTLTSRVSPFGL